MSGCVIFGDATAVKCAARGSTTNSTASWRSNGGHSTSMRYVKSAPLTYLDGKAVTGSKLRWTMVQSKIGQDEPGMGMRVRMPQVQLSGSASPSRVVTNSN